MKVWLDDERPMPDGYDVHCKTAQEAIALIEQGKVTQISLDHYLGEHAGSGLQVAKHIAEAAAAGRIPPMQFTLHTRDPLARKFMGDHLRDAIRFWEEHNACTSW